MTTTHDEHRSRWVLVGLSTITASILALAGIADLFRWGNRWYVSSMFARDTSASDSAMWQWIGSLLDGAHEALECGIVLLALAAAFAAWRVALRRRSGYTR